MLHVLTQRIMVLASLAQSRLHLGERVKRLLERLQTEKIPLISGNSSVMNVLCLALGILLVNLPLMILRRTPHWEQRSFRNSLVTVSLRVLLVGQFLNSVCLQALVVSLVCFPTNVVLPVRLNPPLPRQPSRHNLQQDSLARLPPPPPPTHLRTQRTNKKQDGQQEAKSILGTFFEALLSNLPQK